MVKRSNRILGVCSSRDEEARARARVCLWYVCVLCVCVLCVCACVCGGGGGFGVFAGGEGGTLRMPWMGSESHARPSEDDEDCDDGARPWVMGV